MMVVGDSMGGDGGCCSGGGSGEYSSGGDGGETGNVVGFVCLLLFFMYSWGAI